MQTEIELTRAMERIHALEQWQDKQNGHLEQLSNKLDRLSDTVTKEMIAVRAEINGRFDSIKTWLVGALTSSLLGLLVLALSLALKGR